MNWYPIIPIVAVISVAVLIVGIFVIYIVYFNQKFKTIDEKMENIDKKISEQALPDPEPSLVTVSRIVYTVEVEEGPRGNS